MFHRFQGHIAPTWLILLAVLSCRPNLARADDEAELRAALGEAAALHKKGDFSEAATVCQRALELAERVSGPEHVRTADVLNKLAILYDDMGEYSKAEPLYQRSLKIRESKFGPDHLAVASSLNNMANLYRKMGQYAKAEPLYRRSLKIREAKFGTDHLAVAASLNNLALLNRNMGQYAKAESLVQRSLKMRESKLGPDHPDVAASLNSLAILYDLMRQYAKAEPLYQRSLKIRESKLGPDHPDVASSLSNLAVLYRKMGQYAKAESLGQRSLAIKESKLGSDHPEVAMGLNNMAILYIDMGQYAKAEPLLQRALKTREAKLGPDHPDVVESLNNLAIFHITTEHWSEAVAEMQRERRIVRRHVANTLPTLSEREQLIFLQAKDRKHLHMALSLGLRRRADAQTALLSAGWVLNGKAVAQEAIAQRALLAADATDPTLADLVKRLQAARRRLAALSMTPPKAGQEADYQQKLKTLRRQDQELSRQLGQATGRNTTDDPWVEPDNVRKSLAKDAVLIEMVRLRVATFQFANDKPRWLPPHYVAWLIPSEGQGHVSIVDLGEAQPIDDAVQRARKALGTAAATIQKEGEAAAETQLRDTMRSLAQLVFEPLEAHWGQSRQLILSPDAALWLIPWGAIPLGDGRYAIEKYQIRYCISGRDLVSRATDPKQKATSPILFANPDYDLGPAETFAATRAMLRSAAPVEQLASSRGLGSLNSLPQARRLPGTAEEAAAIMPSLTRYAKTQAVLYQDQYALEGVFKTLQRPQVLVLSTHGFFLQDQEVESHDERTGDSGDDSPRNRAVLTTDGKPLENPLLRCGLLLAGCNRRADQKPAARVDDGILTGLEIVGTNLRGTELVVLSACETGVGQVYNGEGVAGLRQAFQLAGAKAVISTLWQIPDTETVDLVSTLFAYLSAGQTKAGALRSAQLALIQARREAHSAAHPYYWAAFTLTGE